MSQSNKYYIMHQSLSLNGTEPKICSVQHKDQVSGFADIVSRSPKEALLSVLTSSDYCITNGTVLFKVATCERVSECNDTVNFGVRCMSDPKKIYYYRVVWKEVK